MKWKEPRRLSWGGGIAACNLRAYEKPEISIVEFEKDDIAAVVMTSGISGGIGVDAGIGGSISASQDSGFWKSKLFD